MSRTYRWVRGDLHTQAISRDFPTEAEALVWGESYDYPDKVLVTPTDYGPHGVNHGVILDVVGPPYDPLVSALNHFVGLATWAVGEGFGESDEQELAESEAFLRLLETALNVTATRRAWPE